MTSSILNKLLSVIILVLIISVIFICYSTTSWLYKILGKQTDKRKSCDRRPPKKENNEEGFIATAPGAARAPATPGFSAGSGASVRTNTRSLPSLNPASTDPTDTNYIISSGQCSTGWELSEGVLAPNGYIVECSWVEVPPDNSGFDYGNSSGINYRDALAAHSRIVSLISTLKIVTFLSTGVDMIQNDTIDATIREHNAALATLLPPPRPPPPPPPPTPATRGRAPAPAPGPAPAPAPAPSPATILEPIKPLSRNSYTYGIGGTRDIRMKRILKQYIITVPGVTISSDGTVTLPTTFTKAEPKKYTDGSIAKQLLNDDGTVAIPSTMLNDDGTVSVPVHLLSSDGNLPTQLTNVYGRFVKVPKEFTTWAIVPVEYMKVPEEVRAYMSCHSDNPYIGAIKINYDNEPEAPPPLRNPRKVSTPLDYDYETYDYDEYKSAQDEANESKSKYADIKIEEPDFSDVGTMMDNMAGDVSNYPWDYDNKDLKQSESVWGMISPEASKAIFVRCYTESIAQNTKQLTADASGNTYFHSAIAGTSFDMRNPSLANALQKMEQVGMLIAPMVGNMAQDALYDAIELSLRLKKTGHDVVMAGRAVSNATDAVADTAKELERLRSIGAPADEINKAATEASKAEDTLNKMRGELRLAQEASEEASKEAAEKAAKKSLVKATKNSLKAAGRFIKESAEAISKRVAKFMSKLLIKMGIKSAIQMTTTLAVATATSVAATATVAPTFGATAPIAALAHTVLTGVAGIAATLQFFLMFIQAVVQPIMDKYIDGAGTCPPDSKSLYTIIPPAAETILSMFVPVLGDLLDIFYPYVCVKNDLSWVFKVRLKDQPYYSDTTLSTYYHNNPEPLSADDDKKYGRGVAPVRIRELTYDWCNFAHPVMLDRMANFYYTNSLLHPFEDDDWNTCYQYIVEFYGVVASSELSCDVACKMKTVCYQPFTGQNYKESYYCDPLYPDDTLLEQVCFRRFYFIKTDNDPQGLFTVTACTNTNYTAPLATTESTESGGYVPSLPKQFKAFYRNPEDASGGVGWSIAANAAIGLVSVGLMIGSGSLANRVRSGGGGGGGGAKPIPPPTFKSTNFKGGRNSSQSRLSSYLPGGKSRSGGDGGDGGGGGGSGGGGSGGSGDGINPGGASPSPGRGRSAAALAVMAGGILAGGLIPVALQSPIEALDRKLGILPLTNDYGSFIRGDPVSGYKLVTNNDYWTIHQGPIIEDAVGYKPFIKFCEVGAAKQLIDPTNPSKGYTQDLNIPMDQCKDYLTLRDTITYYQKKFPNVRVKVVSGAEPRLGGVCYYKWKEVSYDPATNIEGTTQNEKEVLMEYEIRNRASCIYEPKGIFFPKEKVLDEITAVYSARQLLNYATSITAAAADLAAIPDYNTQNKRTSVIGRLNDKFKMVLKNTEAAMDSLSTKPNPPGNLPVPTYTDYPTAAKEADAAIKAASVALVAAIKSQDKRLDAVGSGSFITDPNVINNNPKYGLITIPTPPLTQTQRQALPPNSPMLNSIIWPTRKMIQEADGTFLPSANPKYPYKPFNVPKTLPPETTLGGETCPGSICQNSDQINTLIQGFNAANRSKGRQIIKVLRAWTPKEDRCDYDVEMMRTYRVDKTTKQVVPATAATAVAPGPAPGPATSFNKVIQRETVQINVKPDPTAECNFIYKSDGSNNINSGTFIQPNTPDLSGADVKDGIMYYNDIVKSLKRTYNTLIAPLVQTNAADKSIDSSKRTYDTSNKVVESVFTNQTLVGCPTKKCSDPDMLTMMADYFNNTNSDKPGNPDVYDTFTEKYASSVIKAGIASGDQCDVMFKVRTTMYDDILNEPSIDYKTINAETLRFNVKYIDNKGPGNSCRFELDKSRGPVFTDVSSTAIGLRFDSSTLPQEFDVVPKKVDCSAPAVLNAVKASIENFLNQRDKGINKQHVLTSVTQTFQQRPLQCMYQVKKSMRKTDGTKLRCSADGGETYTECKNYTSYVNADFEPVAAGAPAAAAAAASILPGNFILKKAKEYDPVDLDYDYITYTTRVVGEVIRVYANDDYSINTTNSVPLMTDLDNKKPISNYKRVNPRIYTLPAR